MCAILSVSVCICKMGHYYSLNSYVAYHIRNKTTTWLLLVVEVNSNGYFLKSVPLEGKIKPISSLVL